MFPAAKDENIKFDADTSCDCSSVFYGGLGQLPRDPLLVVQMSVPIAIAF